MFFRDFLCVSCLLLWGCGDSADEPLGGAGEGGQSEGGSAAEAGAAAGGAGEGGRAPLDPCAGFAVEVVEVSYGPDAGFGQDAMPEIVLGPPKGGGETTGSLDVVALGNGGSITLGFGDQVIEDGEGPDFIVFENAFYAGGDPESPFAELGTVEVSADGVAWLSFECAATEAPYGACAGWHPVIAGGKGETADSHDPATAGGDAFDLADVGLGSARFVRITDRADITGLNGSFDLDAIALVSWSCPGR
jgi:hypothetical protein